MACLVDGLRRLNGLRVITRMTTTASAPEIRAQSEVLRKMLLAMVEDIPRSAPARASRTQTPALLHRPSGRTRESIARRASTSTRRWPTAWGSGSLKWELEDLSFRFLEPRDLKRIARMLDERRIEREQFIVDAEPLEGEVQAIGVTAEVYGRPKHIYSIYNKMRAKRLDFADLR